MSKAYDRVEWSFLEALMKGMGFAPRWVQLIMECVTTVSYSFMLNGNPVGYVIPQRGLRQGDPLSPYLFLLCAEAFSSLILQAERCGFLHGVKLCRGAPSVSHLFFADDSFLFLRANRQDCQHLSNIFHKYEMVSGQKINLEKSSVSFSNNMHCTDQDNLAAILGVRRVDQHDVYLGLPTHVGRSRRQCFNSLKERIWKKVQGWKAKLLSFAGKEILLKVVAQAVPIYMMNCFLIPKCLCDEIQQVMARYWWSEQDGHRKIHWLRWSKLCLPKQEGGLGFRNLYAFNMALLAKQLWRLIQTPTSLVARVMKARYFKNCSILEAQLGHSSSYIWQSLCKARVIIEQGTRWRIGNGNSVRIWGDRWLPSSESFQISSAQAQGFEEAKVSFLIDPITMQWREDLLQAWFSAEEVRCIRNIPLSFRDPPDALIWHFERGGQYTVRTGHEVARRVLLQQDEDDTTTNGGPIVAFDHVWKKIWKVRVPPKVRIFIWRALLNILPTKDNLGHRGISELGGCVFCGADETVVHVLLQCPMAIASWSLFPAWAHFNTDSTEEFKMWFHGFAADHPTHELEKVMVCMWMLWFERNQMIWTGRHRSSTEVVSGAMYCLQEFQELHPPPKNHISRAKAKWLRPPTGAIKINVSGMFHVESSFGGVGLVVRNYTGAFLACKLVVLRGVSNPMHAKLVALREGLIYAAKWSNLDCHIEGDSQGALHSVQQGQADLSHLGCLIEDCKTLLAKQERVYLRFTERKANGVATRLAHYALHSQEAAEWVTDPPVFLQDVLFSDVM
ncbi:unnamed protein product [Prunus armeniaca]